MAFKIIYFNEIQIIYFYEIQIIYFYDIQIIYFNYIQNHIFQWYFKICINEILNHAFECHLNH